MSRKLVKAANERDQKSILKYTEIKENSNITDSEKGDDIVAPTSTERCIDLERSQSYRLSDFSESRCS